MKIQTLASALFRALETKTRPDGTKYVSRKSGSPEWMRDVIHTVHGKKLPDDITYAFIDRCAGELADADEDYDADELREVVDQMGPDVYTSDLTAWLNASNDHVYYMTQATEEMGGDFRDAFQQLSYAQALHIHEVGYDLIDALKDVADTWDTSDFAEMHGIWIEFDKVSQNPNMMKPGWKANHYRVTLRRKENGKRKQMSLYFSVGIGITTPPSPSDVLDTLAMDAMDYEDSGDDIGAWADEFGWDSDGEAAKRTFRIVRRQARALRRFLGSEELYEELLWETERE